MGLKKNWSDWTFALNVTDILNTNIVEITDNQTSGNYNYIHQDRYNRGGSLSITYSFGNQKVKIVRDIEGASDGIKSRTK